MKQSSFYRNGMILIPTASFDDCGGWFVDSEFILQMGAPYLLAHGLGLPVSDAVTRFRVDKKGSYHVYAYTYNWVSPWHEDMTPGIFNVFIDSENTGEFGHTSSWSWEEGKSIILEEGEHTVSLHDLSGFEGRCAYILLSSSDNPSLPSGKDSIMSFYREMAGIGETKTEAEYDYIVIGGGMAGICSAVAASRLGLRTAIVQDRLLVGGNNSSEVRVWLGGGTNYDPFPGIGNIVGEFEQKRIGHYGSVNKADLYEDERKLSILEAEKNLTMYMGTELISSEMDGDKIASVELWDYLNNRIFRISAPLYNDATGDGNLGAMSGADFEVTTNGHMGMTNMWYIEKTESPHPFPRCPWAIDLSSAVFPGRGDTKDIYGHSREFSLGCWFWESGMTEDPIECAERSRDLNFRAMYGAWDTLRNVDNDYQDYDLAYCSAIGGKRESRRLLGDLVLTKADFRYTFPDACVPTTWNFDVHYPDKRFYSAFHEGDAFLTMDCREVFKGPYFLPYRCFYSRNVRNMFMSGRDASFSHDASGTGRIMRTGGMMGEVTAYAAKLCIDYGCLPRDIYKSHLVQFLELLKSIEKKEVHKVGNTID